MKMKKYLILLIIIISIILLVIGTIIITNSLNKSQNEDKYSIDFKTTKKITISYMSNSKELSNIEKDNLLLELKEMDYKVINEPGLIVSTDYKIDFNNGLYFVFGNYGTEVDVYENNQRKFTTKLPNDILNNIRRMFGKVENQDDINDNKLNGNQINVK